MSLKNILIPIITVLGLEFGLILAFAVVTETVFAWPGMGKLIIDAINLLDRPVIVAYLMVTVLIFIIINFVVDVLYSIIDPRVRLAGVRRMTTPAGSSRGRERYESTMNRHCVISLQTSVKTRLRWSRCSCSSALRSLLSSRR